MNYVLLFLQEKVFDLPSTSVKRTATSLTHFAGIERCRAEILKQKESAEPTNVVGDLDNEEAESSSEYDM